MKTRISGESKTLRMFFEGLLILTVFFSPIAAVNAQDIQPPTAEPAETLPDESGGSDGINPDEIVQSPVENQEPEKKVSADDQSESPGESSLDVTSEVPLETPLETPDETVPNLPQEEPGVDGGQQESLGEIVDLIAETNTVIVNQNDEVIPLASEETAAVLTSGDPFFLDPATGSFIGYTSLDGSCPGFVNECNQVSQPLTAALADSKLPVNGTLYIEGNTFYDEAVEINKNLYLQAGSGFSRSGDFVLAAAEALASIRQISLNAGLSGYSNIQADKILVNAGMDSTVNAQMLHDALGLVAQNGTISLSAGLYKDDASDFVLDAEGMTMEGEGDASIIDGNNTEKIFDDGSKESGFGLRINAGDINIRKLKVVGSTFGMMISAPGVKIDHVTIENNKYGIVINYKGSANLDYMNITGNEFGLIKESNSGDVSIHYSNIFNNSAFGIYNDCFFKIDPESPGGITGCTMMSATRNFWGSPEGPTTCGLAIDSEGIGFHDCEPKTGENIVQGKTTTLWLDSATEPMIIHQNIDFSDYAETFICDDSDPGTKDEYIGGRCIYTPISDTSDNSTADAPTLVNETNYVRDWMVVSSLIPVTGGFTKLSCTEANTLKLAGGSSASFSAPLCGFSAGMFEESNGTLPAPLPEGFTFLNGMTLNLDMGGGLIPKLPEPVSVTIQFDIPDHLMGEDVVILFWDPGAENGLGAWIELQSTEPGTTASSSTGTFVLALR